MSCGRGPRDPLCEGDKDDNWEIVRHEDSQCQGIDNANRPAFSFHWGNKFLLQIGGRTDYAQCAASPVPRVYDYGSQGRVGNEASYYNNQAQCIIFRLPLELRQRIYEEHFSIDSVKVHLKWYPTSRLSVLVLLETCRRIHAEAEHVFYSINRLQYTNLEPRPSTSFFHSISPARLESIQNLTICVSSAGEALQICQELAPLRNLRALTIERQQCARYIDVSSWKLLSKQLKAELEKLSSLKALDIVTPYTPKQTPEEQERMRQLAQIDGLLQVSARQDEGQALDTQCHSTMLDWSSLVGEMDDLRQDRALRFYYNGRHLF